MIGAALISLALCGVPGPDDAVGLALRDLYAIDGATRQPFVAEIDRPYTRYVTLYPEPDAGLGDKRRMVNLALNSVSRQTMIEIGSDCPETDGRLMRLDLRQFGISQDAWEDLGKRGSGPVRSVTKRDQPEPYFHQLVRVPEGTHHVSGTRKVRVRDAYGREFDQDQPYSAEETTPAREELVLAPWLEPKRAIALSAATRSQFPVVRWDWLIANVLTAPAYNEILGFRTLKDYQDFVLFDPRAARSALGAVIGISQGVALHQRGILLYPTSYGVLGETLDYQESTRESDILANLRLFAAGKASRPKRDAGELIGNGPNGLQFYLLVDAADKVLDVAVGSVAADTETPWADKQVWTAISCATCHDKGPKSLDDDVRALARPGGVVLTPRGRADYDLLYHQFRRDLDGAPLETPLGTARLKYQQAVGRATEGMTTEDAAKVLQRVFLGYVQDPITMARAAAEVGATEAEACTIIDRIIQPPHTLRQLQAGRKTRRDQWEREGGDEAESGFARLATEVYRQRKEKGR